ncbi:MAG: YdeI/OmpD-associated family protein [Vicinamibacterales bacterium]
MSAEQEPPTIAFASREAWAAWLDEHQTDTQGVWLKIAKVATGIESVTHPEALEVALCYGWIDGLRRSFDEQYYLQRFTPRRPRSRWSQVNCGKVMELIETGKMQPAGLREVERAKADGRWEAAYAAQSAATVPADLQAALDANDSARAFFATLDSRNRYAILHRIQGAKRSETRARRIEQFVTMLSEQRKLYS